MERVSKESIRLVLLSLEEYSKIKALIDDKEVKGDTIPYSYIHEYLEELDPEVRDKLYNDARLIKEKLEWDSKSTSDNSIQNIDKILENILLDIPRINQYESIKVKYDVITEQQIKTKSELQNYSDTFERYKQRMDRMQGEFISILSIFSAVIIAFFGGINLLGSALSSINDVNRYRLIVVVLLIGLIMFNIIYMLLYSISKLINKDIYSSQLQQKCKECNTSLSSDCIKNKYPVVYFYNLISIFIIEITTELFIVDRYNIIISIWQSFKNKAISILFIIIGIVMILFIPVLSIIILKHLSKCNTGQCENNNLNIIEDGFNDFL